MVAQNKELPMVDSATALFCGFTPGEFRALQAPLPPLPFRAVAAGSALQVIETSYFALLLADAPLLPEEDAAIRRFFSEVDGESTVKYIVTQNPGRWEPITNAKTFPTVAALAATIAPLLKKAHARALRAENLAKNMRLSFSVLDAITQNPGIQTEQLTRLIGRGQPAVKRYIEELRLAGKNIQYNATTHGWSLKQP